jgi:hypothetical protein
VRSGALRAATDEVEAVIIEREACSFRRPTEGAFERSFKLVGQSEVADVTTRRADQMVMVMIGEALGEFEPSMIVVGNDPCDGADLFEYGEVAVHARLREAAVDLENLQDRHRTGTAAEHCDNATPPAGVPMIAATQERADIFVQEVGVHRY